MNDDEICLKRNEFYDLVWSEPMQRLAKRFNISDVGLAKICVYVEDTGSLQVTKLDAKRQGRFSM